MAVKKNTRPCVWWFLTFANFRAKNLETWILAGRNSVHDFFCLFNENSPKVSEINCQTIV